MPLDACTLSCFVMPFGELKLMSLAGGVDLGEAEPIMSFPDNMPLSKLLSSLWTPSIPLAGPSKLPSNGLHDSCTKGFHFLIRLAWESRYLLPVMYAVFSFLFDIQMRLEIIIHRERRVVLVEEEPIEEERNVMLEVDDGASESGSQLEDEEEGTSSENLTTDH